MDLTTVGKRLIKHGMKSCVLVLFTLFSMAVHSMERAEMKNEVLHQFGEKVSILDRVDFEAFKLTLLYVAKERNPNFSRAQHFYLARYDKDAKLTYMYWSEMKLLWIMSTSDTDEERQLGVRYPSRGQLIDFKTDVILNNSEVKSSMYLVSKNWAQQRLFETVVEGDLIIVDGDLLQ